MKSFRKACFYTVCSFFNRGQKVYHTLCCVSSSDCPTSIAVRTSEGALQTTGGSERKAQVAAQHRTGKEYTLNLFIGLFSILKSLFAHFSFSSVHMCVAVRMKQGLASYKRELNAMITSWWKIEACFQWKCKRKLSILLGWVETP